VDCALVVAGPVLGDVVAVVVAGPVLGVVVAVVVAGPVLGVVEVVSHSWAGPTSKELDPHSPDSLK
jgi:hypothetical protein